MSARVSLWAVVLDYQRSVPLEGQVEDSHTNSGVDEDVQKVQRTWVGLGGVCNDARYLGSGPLVDPLTKMLRP